MDTIAQQFTDGDLPTTFKLITVIVFVVLVLTLMLSMTSFLPGFSEYKPLRRGDAKIALISIVGIAIVFGISGIVSKTAHVYRANENVHGLTDKGDRKFAIKSKNLDEDEEDPSDAVIIVNQKDGKPVIKDDDTGKMLMTLQPQIAEIAKQEKVDVKDLSISYRAETWGNRVYSLKAIVKTNPKTEYTIVRYRNNHNEKSSKNTIVVDKNGDVITDGEK